MQCDRKAGSQDLRQYWFPETHVSVKMTGTQRNQASPEQRGTAGTRPALERAVPTVLQSADRISKVNEPNPLAISAVANSTDCPWIPSCASQQLILSSANIYINLTNWTIWLRLLIHKDKRWVTLSPQTAPTGARNSIFPFTVRL